MDIRLATSDDLPRFFVYLARQLKENGADDSVPFQPLSVAESRLNDEMRTRFTQGIDKSLQQSGWSRMLLAFDNEQLVGHIDIRPYQEAHTEHRVLLGMGVDKSCRGQGIGSQLLNSMFVWAALHTDCEVIDLWLLTENQSAYKLYQRHDFIQCAQINDMYRIDGRSFGYTMMSRRICS
ncbi:GNAT family N-acetyltransferase [Shewanella algidipiscicola]|uniref:GNAT family N-acetyltransferase n=1 Tax=Shewanella algidipiscicola TaxID=614070 RepID=UPI000D784073|nr:GNAT family N-acetyltransferase [Shewanella algidipiscicola]